MKPVQTFQIIFTTALYRLRADATKTYGGVLWWLFEPLLEMSIYFLLFGIIFQRGGDDYIPYLILGILSWKWLTQVIVTSSNAVMSNKALIQNFNTPKVVYPLIDSLLYTFRYLIIFVPTALVLSSFFYSFSNFHLFFFGIFSEFLLITGAGFFISSILPFFPDLIKLMPTLLRLAFYPSAIIFNLDMVKDENIKEWIVLNPLVQMFSNIRFSVIGVGSFSWTNFILISFLGSVLFGFGLIFFRFNDKKYLRLGL